MQVHSSTFVYMQFYWVDKTRLNDIQNMTVEFITFCVVFQISYSRVQVFYTSKTSKIWKIVWSGSTLFVNVPFMGRLA